jgi:membrane protein
MIKNAWRYLSAFALALPRRLFEDRLTQAAGSLTYTTLLSIVPLLAVALALSTAFPAFDRVMELLREYVNKNFLPEARGVHMAVEQLNAFAVGARKLTGVGLAALGITAVMLMLSIDDLLNRIFRVERKRSLAQRIAMYWAVLTLGPLLIGGGLSMTSALAASSFGVIELDRVAQIVLRLLPFLLTWAALTSLYILVPNRRVALAPALAGGLLAGIAFELAKRGFAIFVSGYPTYTLIYGAFAGLLIFLIWVYVSWLVVLVGATFTATLVEPSAAYRRM